MQIYLFPVGRRLPQIQIISNLGRYLLAISSTNSFLLQLEHERGTSQHDLRNHRLDTGRLGRAPGGHRSTNFTPGEDRGPGQFSLSPSQTKLAWQVAVLL